MRRTPSYKQVYCHYTLRQQHTFSTLASILKNNSEYSSLVINNFQLTLVIRRAISLSNPSEKVKAKPTKRNATFDEKERNLRRQILLWFQIQQIYMPCVAALRERDRRKGLLEPEVAPPHTIRLYLPSSLGCQDREAVSIAPLADKERRLRHAQCMDALLSLRKRLRVGAMLFDRKHAQVAGTGTRKNTRMQALIDRYKTKENRDAECYREARKALERLDPNGTWKKTLLPLRPEDVRAPFRGQVESKRKRSKRRKNALESEGTRVLSWIWKTTAQSRGDDATPVSADVEEGNFSRIVLCSFCLLNQQVYVLSGVNHLPVRNAGRKKLTFFERRCDVSFLS